MMVGRGRWSHETICIQIFVFRGEPDFYYRRHVLLYFTSPNDSNFHETVHVSRDNDKGPWLLKRIRGGGDWALLNDYAAHVNAGAVLVPRGHQMDPVNVAAATPIVANADEAEWSGHHFALGALERLVAEGMQTRDWYEAVADELTEKLLEGAVG